MVAVLSPFARDVTPGASLDQSQDTIEGCAQFTSGVVIGQVFAAGVNGRVSDLLVTLGNGAHEAHHPDIRDMPAVYRQGYDESARGDPSPALGRNIAQAIADQR